MTRNQLAILERRARLIQGRTAAAAVGLILPTDDGKYNLEITSANGTRNAATYDTVEDCQTAFNSKGNPDAALIIIDV